jgi:hypothetical protein
MLPKVNERSKDAVNAAYLYFLYTYTGTVQNRRALAGRARKRHTMPQRRTFPCAQEFSKRLGNSEGRKNLISSIRQRLLSFFPIFPASIMESRGLHNGRLLLINL